MLRSTLIIIIIISVLSSLSACGARGPESDSGQAHSNLAAQKQQNNAGDPETEIADAADSSYRFPPEVALSFQPVEWHELVLMEPKETWEFVRTLSFGTLDDNPVSLAIYKETGIDQPCGFDFESVALLEYRSKTYHYEDCFSMDLMTAESPWLESNLVEIGYENKDGSSRRIVHGAAALYGNGPGRMVYLVYDSNEDRWYGFDNWGSPSVVDLDGEGTKELVNQFEGLHMHFPDIDLYRWNGPGLEQSLSVKSALQLPYVGQSVAMMDKATHQFQISALTTLEEDAWEHPLVASYEYIDGRIVRSDAGGK